MSLAAHPAVPPRVQAKDFGAEVDGRWVLEDVSLRLPGGVTALLGDPNAGHRVFAAALGRSLEVGHRIRVAGCLCLDGRELYASELDATEVRRRVPTLRSCEAFPGSVFDDVAFALRASGVAPRGQLVRPVERALRRVGLWNRVGEQLDTPSSRLPAGLRPRLALARALTLGPDALVLDLSRGEREALADLLADWGSEPALLVLSDRVDRIVRRARSIAFFADHRLVEAGPAPELLTRPRTAALEAFLRRGAAG